MIEIRTILAPTDFSPHAEGAVRYACGLAERFGAELHLIHVLSEMVPTGPDPTFAPVMPPDYYQQIEGESRELLDRQIDPSWGTPTAVANTVLWGNPVEEIVAHARDRKIDLIVIATHGRTGLSHALLGSVAERIIREAPCPVLTIRSK